MKLVIQGKNLEITEAIRTYVSQKIEKAVSHFQSSITEVDVNLSVARNPRINPARQSAEVTIYVNRAVVRAEESSENLYASIDLVTDKISRQLKRYKDKRRNQDHNSVREAESPQGSATVPSPDISAVLNNKEPQLPKEVVRSKYFAMPPMSVHDALEQLELVGHSFFMFCNAETGELNVIYERNHGGYGLIQPRPTASNNSNGHHSNGKQTFTELTMTGNRKH
jgi:putative sigma-54 modulation protein